jgi:hypothetical protein
MSRSTSRATIRFKVVEMLQQNWALIEPSASRVTVYFIHDTGGVFDEILCASADAAASAMRLNGFSRFADDRTAVPASPIAAVPSPTTSQWSDLLVRPLLENRMSRHRQIQNLRRPRDLLLRLLSGQIDVEAA